MGSIPDDDWFAEPAPDKWSPAALTLHVTDAYEMGLRALAGGSSMRLRIPRWKAWFYRTTLLPHLMRRGEFPRVRAPREIQPDLALARTRSRAEALERLRTKAREAGAAFRAAETTPNAPRLTHAYFGDLPPYLALRFLTTHTQHHTKGILRSLERTG
jgi:hypothetical protein